VASAGCGLGGGSSILVSGVVSGCQYGVHTCTGFVVSGVVSGCVSGLWTCTSCTVSGVVSGCQYGFNACPGFTLSGVVRGCQYSVYAITTFTVSGVVRECQYGLGISNGTGGGLWGAAAIWVGGIIPLIGDDVIIIAGAGGGDIVTVNVTTAPINSCLVQSHATTPATLRFMDGYNGILNIKSGATATNRLQGNATSATCRGRMLAINQDSGLVVPHLLL
jgi:hypothetical protein